MLEALLLLAVTAVLALLVAFAILLGANRYETNARALWRIIGEVPTTNLMKLAGVGLAGVAILVGLALLTLGRPVTEGTALFLTGLVGMLLGAAHAAYVTKRKTFLPGMDPAAPPAAPRAVGDDEGPTA